MPGTSIAKNVVVISLSLSLFVAILMGFIIGSLVEDLKLRIVQSNVEALLNEKFKETPIAEGIFANPESYREIYAELNAKDPLIVGLNVIDDDGIILFSDEQALIGKEFSDKEKVSKTLKGQASYFIDRNLVSQEAILKESHVHVMVLFYPYAINNRHFAIQVIYDIFALEKDINKINALMWFTILSSVGVLFVSLTVISSSNNKSLEELKNSLEIKVKERTAELEKAKSYLDKRIKESTEEIQKQNMDLIRKTIELNELKGDLEDKNMDLSVVNKDMQKQNMDLIRNTIELTELKGELEDKNMDLIAASKQMLNTLEAKTQFINQAAHDLGTPLTPVLALLPIIKKSIKDKKTLYDLTIVENNAKYLRAIVEELISLIKTEAKQADYKFQKLNLNSLISKVVENNGIIFSGNKIKVISQLQEKLPSIEGDGHKLTELLQNIISNSVKFMPKGGVLTISSKKTDNFINVRISDTGIGMTKNTLSNLFEEFFKADKSRHYQGSGLGLSICRRIAEGHNGKIWAESQGLGKGSAILFNLPIKQPIK